MDHKIAQLILTPRQKASSTSEIFVAQPDAAKEALAGKLFILIEIESKKASDLKIINFLTDTLNHNYYQNEKMILRERLSTLKIEHIFESALSKTNKKLAEFIQNEKIRFNPRLINATMGVIYGNNLHFTNLGKNRALLIYKHKTEDGQSSYKLTDITQQTVSKEPEKQINLNKIFSSVISGPIPSGGYFLFANETLPEYLSNKQLINVITTLPPASAIEQIKNMLANINAYVPFLGMIIKNTKGSQVLESQRKIIKPSTQSSMENLNTTKETTEKLLTPSGIIRFERWSPFLSSLFGRIKIKSRKKFEDKKTFLLKDKVFLKRKVSKISIQKTLTLFRDLFVYLVGLFLYIYKMITDKEKMIGFFRNAKTKIVQIITTLRNSLNNFTFWFRNLDKKNKILFSVFSICLILLIQNLIWINFKNTKNEKQIIFEDLVKKIEQKQNQTDASLLYGNNEKAKELLTEIRELLNEFPQKTNKQKELYEKFLVKNTEHLEKISNVIKIQSPTELANFTNLNSEADPANIVLANEKIYANDGKQKSIYNLDISNNLVTAIANIGQSISALDYPAVNKNSNKIYYLNSGNIIELDTGNDEIKNLNMDYVGNLSQITDMRNFNNRLYFLDSGKNEIYRYDKSTSEFITPKAWLTEKVDLSDASSMDIDGNIYILKKDGQILKFLKGQLQDFSLESIEPPLERVTRLIISQELKYIYVLEPDRKRLAVFDKSGQFLNQYVGEQFNDLKDFAVDEKNKKIYFLNSASVYAIDGQHFDE